MEYYIDENSRLNINGNSYLSLKIESQTNKDFIEKLIEKSYNSEYDLEKFFTLEPLMSPGSLFIITDKNLKRYYFKIEKIVLKEQSNFKRSSKEKVNIRAKLIASSKINLRQKFNKNEFDNKIKRGNKYVYYNMPREYKSIIYKSRNSFKSTIKFANQNIKLKKMKLIPDKLIAESISKDCKTKFSLSRI